MAVEVKDIKVSISIDEIEQRLSAVFKEDHKKIMTQCMMELLSSDSAMLEVIFKASLGIIPKLDYSVDDEVIVKSRNLSDWRFNEKAMKKAGMITDANMVVKITNAQKFSSVPYIVTYDYLDDDDKTNSTTSDIQPYQIIGPAEEFPGEE
jgi:hypothetical protein